MPALFAGQPPVLWALALFFLCLGFTAPIDIPLALLAMTAAFSLNTHPRRGWLVSLREHAAVAAFLFVTALTTVFSVDWRHSVAVQPQLLPALLCYVVTVSFVTTPAATRFVCMALLASGLLTAVLMLLGTWGGGSDPLSQIRLLGNALLIVPNDVLMLAVIAPLATGLVWGGNWWLRGVVALFLCLALLASVVVQSRQAVILLLLGQVAVVTLMRPRWAVPVLLIGAVTGLVVDGLLGWPLAHKIFMFPRTYVWHTAWVMFLDSPWLGQGPGMFKDLYFPFLQKAGYVLESLGDRRSMPWAHSLYLEQLAERGVPGLLALLILLGVALKQSAVACQRQTEPAQRGLAAGALAALLVFGAAGVAEATLSRLWVMVMLFLLAGFAVALSHCVKLVRGMPASCEGGC